MEIKVGDKVRVSKDIPQFYRKYNLYRVFEVEHQVVDIEDGLALLDSIPPKYVTTLPLKHLTKVNAEEKEAKFKVGEIVRYRYDGRLYIVECKTGKYYYTLRQVGGDIMMHDVLESDLELVTEPKQGIKIGDVIDTPKGKGTVRISYGDYWVAQLDNGEWYIHMETNMPYAPYTEPKEQAEGKEPKFHIGDIVSYEGISGSMRSGRIISNRNHSNLYGVCSGIDIFHVEEEALNLYNPIKDGYISPIESEPCNTDDTDWDAYAADLAHDLALKVANKYSDPKEAADYAVSVAKAVVENLKKK